MGRRTRCPQGSLGRRETERKATITYLHDQHRLVPPMIGSGQMVRKRLLHWEWRWGGKPGYWSSFSNKNTAMAILLWGVAHWYRQTVPSSGEHVCMMLQCFFDKLPNQIKIQTVVRYGRMSHYKLFTTSGVWSCTLHKLFNSVYVGLGWGGYHLLLSRFRKNLGKVP